MIVSLETKIKIIILLCNVLFLLNGNFLGICIIILNTQIYFHMQNAFILKSFKSYTRFVDFLLIGTAITIILQKIVTYHATSSYTALLYNFYKLLNISFKENLVYIFLIYLTFYILTICFFYFYSFFIINNNFKEKVKNLQKQIGCLSLVITITIIFYYFLNIKIFDELIELVLTYTLCLNLFWFCFKECTLYLKLKNQKLYIETIFYINVVIFFIITFWIGWFFICSNQQLIYEFSFFDKIWHTTQSTQFILIYWQREKKAKFLKRYSIYWLRWIVLIKQFLLQMYRSYMPKILKKIIKIKK